MNYKIAVITPKIKNDYLTDTVIDGLLSIKKDHNNFYFRLPFSYPGDFNKSEISLADAAFMDFAINSDLIIFMWGKDNTDYDRVKKINRFDKTIFIDGSEIGKNGRYDYDIQKEIISDAYNGRGAVDLEMEKKCALYFKREKPYLRDILPFPFGIERKYYKFYSADVKKDIDFFCVFGQDEYPLLRRHAREMLEKYCAKNNLVCHTSKTKNQDEFYSLLSRSKVGISVGGGGYDTARFWEILGNNCILFTETIDIYEPDSSRLKYDRIWQFKNLFDFAYQLEKLGQYLGSEYKQENMKVEYEKIISEHSAKTRVEEIIEICKQKKII